jgi:hypothetical protein
MHYDLRSETAAQCRAISVSICVARRIPVQNIGLVSRLNDYTNDYNTDGNNNPILIQFFESIMRHTVLCDKYIPRQDGDIRNKEDNGDKTLSIAYT